MTEAEIWKLIAQPVIFAITMLAFLKLSWKGRLLGALVGAAIGFAIGFISLWAQRSGAPSWMGWMGAAVILAVLGVRSLLRRSNAGRPRMHG
jgi:hypothetical protein